jgi:hypothetical protein
MADWPPGAIRLSKKIAKFLRFSFKNWKKSWPPKRYSGLSRPLKLVIFSPSCSGMSTPYAWVFWALETAV